MKTSNILRWAIAVGFEALLIAAFVIFGPMLGMPTNVIVLDTVCASILLQAVVLGVSAPIVDRNNPAQPQIASLGISLYGLKFYAWACVLTIIAGIILEIAFKYQLLLQCLWLVVGVLFIAFSSKAKEQAEEVYHAETAKRNGVEEMRRAMRNAVEASYNPGVPQEVKARLEKLSEEMRFLSPCDSDEARECEDSICSTLGTITRALNSSYEMNREAIDQNIEKASRTLTRRKNAFSR